VRLAAETLYAALDRLTDEDLIEVDREETVTGGPRRYCRLTRTGADALAAAAEQMRHDALLATQRPRRAGPGAAPSTA
jgi:DNA-binding PadR family transcriptional regulator